MQIMQTRRRFLAGAAMAGAAGIVGLPKSLHAEPPLETTTVRLPQWVGGSYCWAGAYIAGELMRAEGFTDVRYVEGDRSVDQSEWIARGETDFSVNFPPNQIASIDAGVPIKVLTGLHSGCLELIAKESIRSVADLRGKRVGVDGFNNSRHVWLTLMSAYVGLDPVNDIQWVLTEDATPTELFVQGKIDAFLGTPPQPQELRAKKIGHTILNNAVDRPWSQYFCCMVSATTDYVNRYPVATKRVLRSILKAADLCVSNPQRVARQMVDRDFVPSYDYALQTLKDIRYDRWREFDPEDSLRFYTLRMQETGMIKSSPQQTIADGTDWRFLDELKRELKT
ncbi:MULTISPECIES: ABC transporter substrate-binding protein [unclassified Mesorhizobium]|uniref:ABC transporter substrate-binding protein n=1 Tax=unclassified Mesorhizobium TaxID=325217 RepID=UPI00333B42AD